MQQGHASLYFSITISNDNSLMYPFSFLFFFCFLIPLYLYRSLPLSIYSSVKNTMQAKGIKSYPKIEGLGCSPYASMVYGCVNAETFLHCPPEMWQNESSCNLAKSFAQQCNPLPHVPMPMI